MNFGLDSNKLPELDVPIDQLARQAAASLGGHLFQAVRAATEWMQLGDDASMLVEVAEDYAVLVRDALAMTQTKQEFSTALTLRSDGVRKSLAGWLAFQDANPSLRVTLTYLTTAEPGREAGSPLPDGVTAIGYWREVARGADIAPLRQLLLHTQKDDRLLRFVRETTDEELRTRLVQRVSWLTGSPALAEAQAVLEARLRALGAERTGYADDGGRALPFVLRRVLETAVADERVLTRADFEQEWTRATTVSVSVSMMRQMAALGAQGGGVPLSREPPPPTLSARTAPRGGLVDDLRGAMRDADVLWLHGSSGLGKSQLARLLAARDNAKWEFVSLDGCKPAEQEARVQAAVARIARDDFAGMIFDDLPVPTPEGLRRWIAAASMEVAGVPSARIIVTSEREPLPQARMAFEPLRVAVREAPYLERSDVEHMVSAAGGDPEAWAALIHLACGGGHPLLVDARIAGLASKGWPAGERLNGLGVGDSPSEIADVQREVSLRLLGELSSDAHQLLLRLAGLIGNFDRHLMEAVAAVEPAIPRAGALFDFLVGPWIEQKRADRYGLSPLLTAASTSLSASEKESVYTAAIDDLIKRNPFPGDLLSALVVYAMIVRHVPGLMFVGHAVISTQKHAELASELFPLIYMKSGENGLLVPEHPGVSAILRTAQVIAAVNTDPPRMVGQLVSEALDEAARLPDKLRGANTFTTLLAVLGNEGADLAPAVWMPMLVQYRETLASNHMPTELADVMNTVDLGGLKPDQMFFIIRSNKVDTVADVEELFNELEGIDPTWRRELLSAGPTLLKGPPLFVQKGWSSETGPATLDAAAAEVAYARMTDRAIAWGEDEIAIECIRARAVMLDEYLGRHDEALAVLDDADQRFGKNERLVRSRATVLATMGRHAEELELLSTLGPTYSEDEPLERMLMLRTAAISAARLGQFAQAASLFKDAHAAASDDTPKVLATSVRPGLLADAAIMEFRAGRLADGITSLLDALDHLSDDGLGDETTAFAYSAITHVTQWATAELEARSFPEDPSANPGVCSTLQPKFDPAQMEPRKLNQELYLLARLEAIGGVAVGALARLLEREQADGVHVRLATGVSAAQIERYIRSANADAVIECLPRHASLSGLLVRAGSADGVHEAPDVVPPEDWAEVEAVTARAAVSGLLGMLVLNRRLDEAEEVADRIGRLSPSLGALLQQAEDATDPPPDFFSSGIAALKLVRENGQLSPKQLLRASVELFMWLRVVGVDELSMRAHGILAAHWLDLARNRRALLSTPRLSVPAIEAAAAARPDISGIARLVEAGRLGSSLELPAHVVEMLKGSR